MHGWANYANRFVIVHSEFALGIFFVVDAIKNQCMGKCFSQLLDTWVYITLLSLDAPQCAKYNYISV